ncbi:MAG: hypothetical protein AMJ93_15190 [Anaerolineae bacterium SM23_84]|jgi:hypothetical protein|nr:MAG: hypothetical protein AMJ93_15190 [Anaerolineae bacterium SM23_84]
MQEYDESTQRKVLEIDEATAQILAALSGIQSEIEYLRISQERAQQADAGLTPRPGPSFSPGPIELTLATAALSAFFATLGTGLTGVLVRAVSFVAFLLSCAAGFSFFSKYVQGEFPEAAKASKRVGDVLGIVGSLRLWALLFKRKRDRVTTPAEDTLFGLLSLAFSLLLMVIVLVIWFVASLLGPVISLLR